MTALRHPRRLFPVAEQIERIGYALWRTGARIQRGLVNDRRRFVWPAILSVFLRDLHNTPP